MLGPVHSGGLVNCVPDGQNDCAGASFAWGPLLYAQSFSASEAARRTLEKQPWCVVRSPGSTTQPRSRGKPTFIDLDKPYPSQDFTIVIWDDDRAKFGDWRNTRPAGLCPWDH
jgi:hypothetical protein